MGVVFTAAGFIATIILFSHRTKNCYTFML